MAPPSSTLHTTSSSTRLSAVGTLLCWRLTRCHRKLPSQVSYGLIGRLGLGIKYSKPFVCICKHSATRISICPAEVRAEVGTFSWLSALHCNPSWHVLLPAVPPTPDLMDTIYLLRYISSVPYISSQSVPRSVIPLNPGSRTVQGLPYR